MTNSLSLLGSVSLCPPTAGDALRVLQLMIRRDMSEYGQADSSLEDLQYDWDHIDLQHDAWLAPAPDGDLVGYAAVVPWLAALRYDVYLDPSAPQAGPALGQALLARCQARGAELARDGACQPLARLYVAHVNTADRALVEAAGFRPVQYHFQMRIHMDAPPPLPDWPAGVAVRTAVAGRDDRAIHALIQTAFDRPGRTPQSFESWQEFMMQPDLFSADLWFLAEAGGELAGACLCLAYPEMGWVRQLGVAESWRRRGLGSALLRHAFDRFWARQQPLVGLAVNGENETAVNLYEAAGMRRVQQYDEYQQPIIPAP